MKQSYVIITGWPTPILVSYAMDKHCLNVDMPHIMTTHKSIHKAIVNLIIRIIYVHCILISIISLPLSQLGTFYYIRLRPSALCFHDLCFLLSAQYLLTICSHNKADWWNAFSFWYTKCKMGTQLP